MPSATASLPADPPPGPRRPRRPSLVRRLTWLSVLILAAALLLSTLSLATLVHRTLRQAQVHGAQDAAGLLVENIAPALAFQDRAATQAALEVFSRRPGLRALYLWVPGGQAFARWPQAGAAEPVPPPGIAPVQVSWSEVRLVLPVVLQGERLGTLLWVESFDGLNATLLTLGLGALVVLALSLVGTILVLSWAQRRALWPLISLSRLAERVAASQDYSLRADVGRLDEVGRLAERVNGMLRRIEVWHEDMNQQLAQEQESGRAYQLLAHKDALTGLPNRLAFELTVERQLLDNQHHGGRMALLFIDLDNFKQVNDCLGHAAGDQVLIEVSRRMSALLRSTDTLFRLGGDEFSLIVADANDPKAVEHLAERLIAGVREPLVLGGHTLPVGATVGMAFAPDDAVDPQSLLQAADAAMYAAKHAGKNTYRRALKGDPGGALPTRH